MSADIHGVKSLFFRNQICEYISCSFWAIWLECPIHCDPWRPDLTWSTLIVQRNRLNGSFFVEVWFWWLGIDVFHLSATWLGSWLVWCRMGSYLLITWDVCCAWLSSKSFVGNCLVPVIYALSLGRFVYLVKLVQIHRDHTWCFGGHRSQCALVQK